MTDEQDTTRVRIAYDPNDLDRIGSVEDLPTWQARQLVREGRAAYAEDAELLDSHKQLEVVAALKDGNSRGELIALAEAHGLDITGTKEQIAARLVEAGVNPS